MSSCLFLRLFLWRALPVHRLAHLQLNRSCQCAVWPSFRGGCTGYKQSIFPLPAFGPSGGRGREFILVRRARRISGKRVEPKMTPQEYEESLRKLNLVVYMFGERIENVVDNPIIRPSMNAVAKTYELALRPEFEAIMTARSHLTGKKVNRFTHIHQGTDDLVNKSKMGRLLGRETGCCFQRCVGTDALNALSIVTYNIDKKYGRDYYHRFLKYLAYVQENDLTCDGAMTDPKGDRSLPPHAQADPDLFLRIVSEREDGIVVRGAKAHQTGAINSHEIIVMPTIAIEKKMRTTRWHLPFRATRPASPPSWGGSRATRENWKAEIWTRAMCSSGGTRR